ncbi:MAG: DUF3108 domain-containing protein [Wenzhouxiangellaceae bacterium]|nr:DUF3108 domain-containing protein [Wenzhouxiangellaceae bacterium]MBS3822695.1 DUF3108 domain-containing protein [Wenzhouxiangellaceae bacterium]
MNHRPTARRLFWIATSTLLAGSCLHAAESPPFQPFDATYTVQRGNAEIGRLKAVLEQREDGLWHYRIESEATAWYVRLLGISTTESAWFQWTGEGVLPLTYHHVSREPGSDRFWQHRYDWRDMHTETRTHDGEFEIELADGVVDPLTLRLEAAARLAEQAPEFESFELSVLERDEIEKQRYRHTGTETLEIDGRCFRTVVFKRFRKEGSSRNYTAWHAESLGWMPLRIRHEDDGKPITLTLDTWDSPATDLPARTGCGSDQAAGKAVE